MAVVRVQALSGTWETLGVDRYPGLLPEGVQCEADESGPTTISFRLQRDPLFAQFDLRAWTPCEVEENGKVIWEGRIRETPGQHGTAPQIAISGEGWQQHWDDSPLERSWVTQDLSKWVDSRNTAYPGGLFYWVASPQIATDALGSVAITIPTGSYMTYDQMAGVTLDFGEYNGPIGAAVLTLNVTALDSAFTWGLATHDYHDYNLSTSTMATGSGATLTSGTFTIGSTFSPGWRYLTFFLNTIYPVTLTADLIVQITSTLVCGANLNAVQLGDPNPADPNSGQPASSGIHQSDLRASDVILDAATATLPFIAATSRSPAYKDEVVGDAPQSYWRLGTDTPPIDRVLTGGVYRTADLGTLNNPIAAQGANAQTGATGLLIDDTDQGLTFAGGATAYAAVAATSAAKYTGNASSIEALIQPTALTVQMDIVALDPRIALYIDSSHKLAVLTQTAYGAITWTAASLTLVTGAIYHIIACFDPIAGVYLFVNGVAQTLTQSPAYGPTVGALNAATTVQIGNDSTRATGFVGIIDEVSVYGYSMDLHTITNHYQAARARLYGDIQRTQYKIPSYGTSGAKTFREHATAVNALHGWKLKVGPNRSLVFQPQNAAPLLRAAANVDFREGGANTSDEVFNRCVVEATDATGVAVRSTVLAAEVLPTRQIVTTGMQVANPGFETNTTGWSQGQYSGTSTFTSASGAAHSGIAGGQLVGGGTSSWTLLSTRPQGPETFRLGAIYALTIWFKITPIAAANWGTFYITLGPGAVPADTSSIPASSPEWGWNKTSHYAAHSKGGHPVTVIMDSVWTPLTCYWAPTRTFDATEVRILIAANIGVAQTVQFDDVSVSQVLATAIDQRGFLKSKLLTVQNTADEVTAYALASAFLQSNGSLPFRGDFIAAKTDDVLLQPGDVPVHPSELLLHTAELVRLPLVDPNTGDIGRDGKIAHVTYDATAQTAAVTIDDDRSRFEALLTRMGATQPSG